jgi:magnesium chelatase accessory protein
VSGDLVWERDGRAWPNRAFSSLVRAGGLTWHVQSLGEGPILLLAHGTGASTHSWRALAPALARHFTVVAPDLPGHAFTSAPAAGRQSLAGMSADLGALVEVLGIRPALVAGHSAGAAILCRMALDGRIAPKGVVSLNGALLAFRGVAGHLFGPLAKLLASSPLTSHILVATMSGRRSVERLLEQTGSTIDERGIEIYTRLVASPAHVGAALGMMASWDLEALERDLPRLGVPLLQIVGGNDRSIPPAAAFKVRNLVPGATVIEQRGLGHLAHEERPEETADAIAAFARQLGLIGPA